MGDPRKRVKVYALGEDKQWKDEGTGHIAYSRVNNQYALVVLSEIDRSILLDTKISPDIAYQKQQDTLIVWCERKDVELALSFQEKAGCDAIWDLISQVQCENPDSLITVEQFLENSDDDEDADVFVDLDGDDLVPDLPSCELSNLQDLRALLCRVTSVHQKEKLSCALKQCDYFNKLIDVFHLCQESHSVESIELLQDIFKLIMCLNRTEVLEEIFKEEIIFDVVGCLEYNSSSIEPMKHREFLKKSAQFREVVPITDPELLEQIHLTYRVQFIHDVVLAPKSLIPTALEENVLGYLSSFLYISKGRIVSLINEDKTFLKKVFDLLNDRNTASEKCRYVMMFLKELCSYSHCLGGVVAREKFLIDFFSFHVFQSFTATLMQNDEILKCLTLEVLHSIIECLPTTARNFILRETVVSPQKISFTCILIKEILSGCDCHLPVTILKLLLNSESIEPVIERTDGPNFLNMFFKNDMLLVVDFILKNSLPAPQLSGFSCAHILEITLDFLMFCLQNHCNFVKDLIFQNDLLKRVLLFMQSSHTFLALSALRLLRSIIALKDDSCNQYIMNGKLFTPVVEAFVKNCERRNLLYSAILELLQFIRKEEMKDFCRHIFITYESVFNEMKDIKTFQEVASLVVEAPNVGNGKVASFLPRFGRKTQKSLVFKWRKALNLRSSEEALNDSDGVFNASEIDVEPEMNGDGTELIHAVTISESTPHAPTKSDTYKNPGNLSSKKRQLVDYGCHSSDGDDDDEEEEDDDTGDDNEDDNSNFPHCKRCKVK